MSYILDLSVEDLIKEWKSKCDISQTAFCKMYDINQSNFVRFIKGTKESTKSIESIRSYLMKHNNTTISQVECNNIYPQLIELINKGNIKKILFIDGDNAFKRVDQLMQIGIQSDLLVVMCLSHGNRSVNKLISPQSITFHSLTNMKDAVDQALTVLMTMLNVTIDKTIQFILASDDYYAFETSLQMHLYGRSCIILRNHQDIRFILSSKTMPPIPSKDTILLYNDDKLKECFEIFWCKSIGEFCDKYNVDQGHLCSWLNKAKYKNTESVNAIRAYLLDL